VGGEWLERSFWLLQVQVQVQGQAQVQVQVWME
jgi:hypothetical protein